MSNRTGKQIRDNPAYKEVMEMTQRSDHPQSQEITELGEFGRRVRFRRDVNHGGACNNIMEIER